MNIGRTIRVFRAEPVMSPVPAPAPADETREPGMDPRPPVEVDGPVAAPVRLGG